MIKRLLVYSLYTASLSVLLTLGVLAASGDPQAPPQPRITGGTTP